VWFLAALVAPAAAAPSNQDCLMCHADQSLTRSGPKATSVFVNQASLAASVHAKLACVSCHRGVNEAPHAEKLPAVRCSACHAAQADSVATSTHGHTPEGAEQACRRCHGTHEVKAPARGGTALCAACHGAVTADYQASIHGVALAGGDRDASTCRDCHGSAHVVRSHLDPRSSTSHARLAETCGHCHSDRALVARRKITIPEAVQLFRNSVHGRSGNPHAAVCNDCHESHRLRRASDPTSSIYRTNIPTTCGRCHSRVAQDYRTGVHGTALRRGVTASPVCTDCHGEHLIRGPGDPNSPVAAAHVSETCARCHDATGIRETFGLPAGRLATYRDSYHGLAARGGSPVVANCASCHGYHDILPSNDPRSAVSPQRLPETCGRCHPGAGTRFAMGPVHVAMTTSDQPILFWVRIAYLWIIGLTIGLMLLHNALDFARKSGRHLQAHLGTMAAHHEAATRWFERMTPAERIQHALLAVSFFTLVYTGFALKFPEAWLFAWFARLEGGYSWRGLIHRGAAVMLVGTALYHVVYLLTRRGRGQLTALVPRISDARDAGQNMLYLLGLRKAPPQFDRYGYIEKAEYWALIWGTAVMTLTGVVLWFENQSLQILSKWVLDLATIVHYYEAWLAFLAIVVWHLYQTVVNPDVYPMNWTWLTGRVSDAQLKHEHYLEWAGIVSAEGGRGPAQHGASEREATSPAPEEPGAGDDTP
jgi:cytochrome b subunit of formate dehydrogenase